MTLNFWMPPLWPKMALNPRKKLEIDLNPIFYHDMKGAPNNLESWLKIKPYK